MRKSIIATCFAACMALFFAISASAQYLPQQLEWNRGKMVDQNGVTLSESEIISAIGDEIYHETYVGAIKQYKAGGALILSGSIVAGVGLVGTIGASALLAAKYPNDLQNFTSTGKMPNNNRYFKLGVLGMTACCVLTGLGVTALSAGIPLRVIGNRRLNWVASNYNEQNAPQAWVRFGAGEYGTGLVVNF